jgi:hypothetical protein
MIAIVLDLLVLMFAFSSSLSPFAANAQSGACARFCRPPCNSPILECRSGFAMELLVLNNGD